MQREPKLGRKIFEGGVFIICCAIILVGFPNAHKILQFFS